MRTKPGSRRVSQSELHAGATVACLAGIGSRAISASSSAARRALLLDPVNTARYNELAWVLALGGQPEQALQQIEHALQLNPRSFETYLMQGWTNEIAGNPQAAFAAFRNGLRIGGASQASLEKLDLTYRAEGLGGCYRIWLNRQNTGATMSQTWRAQVYARIGEPGLAIEALQQAYQKREGALAWLNVEPSFRTLRSDERFQRIASHIGRAN